jgi:two-component system NtrC family sensor kinase
LSPRRCPPQPVLLALFERINEGVLLFREDGSVAVANAAVREMLGAGRVR